MRNCFREGLRWELRLWDLYQVITENHKLMSFPLASKDRFGADIWVEITDKNKIYTHIL